MRRLISRVLLACFPLIVCGCQPQLFDPSNQAMVDSYAQRADMLAAATGTALTLTMQPADVITTKAVLERVRNYVNVLPSTASIADVRPVVDLVVNDVVADATKKPLIRAVAYLALDIADNLIRDPPPGSTLAAVAQYSAAVKQILLAGLNSILNSLPTLPVAMHEERLGVI